MHLAQPGHRVGDRSRRSMENVGAAAHLRDAQQQLDRVLVDREVTQAGLDADEVAAAELVEQDLALLLRNRQPVE